MIAIVTDSSAGISREDAKEWGISIVPMTYTADEKQFFEDYIGKKDAFPVKGWSLNSQLHSVPDCSDLYTKTV